MKRRTLRATVACVVAAATLAVLAAGCGGTHNAGIANLGKTPSPSSSQGYRSVSTRADLLAASDCMRKHGVPNFPNPIFLLGRYRFGFTAASAVNPDTPQFKTAYKFCAARYLGAGKSFSPAQEAQWREQAFKYAKCIRAHGLTDFPDPPAGQSGLEGPEILLPASLPDNYLGTPIWLRASKACKSLSTGIAVAWAG